MDLRQDAPPATSGTASSHHAAIGDTIVSGTVRTPAGWVPGEVHIREGKVLDVRAHSTADDRAFDEARRLDYPGSVIIPGAVDAHVHSLSHGGEGIAAATSAAAAGGVTTIVEMPFDGDGAINTVDRLRAKQQLASQEAVVDIALLGTLEPGGGWRRCADLVEAGAVGFKVSLFDTDPRRFPRINDAELREVMAAIAEAGSTLCTHAENNEIIKHLLAVEGTDTTDPYSHPRSRPPVSETLGVLTAMEIAAEQGNALHVCHLSLGRSVQLVRWYQEQGVDVTLETCPHYLTFAEDDIARLGGQLKINPPVRSAADREALWQGVLDGTVSVISSDHAPWPVDYKNHEQMLRNHSGAPGVQTMVGLTLAGAYARDGLGAGFTRAVEALTIAPARRYGLDHAKGSLEVGKDADLVIFDPKAEMVIRTENMFSNAGWTPYDGMPVTGRVVMTMQRGTVAHSAEQGLIAARGAGALVNR